MILKVSRLGHPVLRQGQGQALGKGVQTRFRGAVRGALRLTAESAPGGDLRPNMIF